MQFERCGKSFQMVLENGKDLKEALTLDEALWMALSAPTEAFLCDQALMHYLDEDNDKRITARELTLAISWMLDILPNYEKITRDFDGNLQLADITDKTPEGQALLHSAQYVAPNQPAITLEQLREYIKKINEQPLNGDGVLNEKAANAEAKHPKEICALIHDVIAANGGKKDIDGSAGIDEATLDAFLADLPVYLNWLQQGKIPEGQETTDIMSLGIKTPELYLLLKKNENKIDQFFALSQLLNFDSRLQGKTLSTEAKVTNFDPASDVTTYQDALPLAAPCQNALLQLDAQLVNPAYRDWFATFLEQLIFPILGTEKKTLNLQEWTRIKNIFKNYKTYLDAKKGDSVAALSEEKIQYYLQESWVISEAKELMAKDKEIQDILAGVRNLEKLILYRTYMIQLVNNFISFSDLYNTKRHAMFECGKLVIDGRWFSVCFKIPSPAAHQAACKGCLVFLIYAEIVLSPTQKMNIVVPVTNGTQGNLKVGKRGLFYDFFDKEYDAKITAVTVNPICVKEAILGPILKLGTIVENRINSWSGDAEKKLQTDFTKAITPSTTPAKPADSKSTPNAVMGIGIAVAALGSSFAFISKTISSMSGLQIWGMVLIALLAVILPFSIITMIKLAKQDISTVLEGCGWSINLKVGLNSQLRQQFTAFGKYPPNAKGTPRSFWLKWLLLILLFVVLCTAATRLYNKCCPHCPVSNQEEIKK